MRLSAMTVVILAIMVRGDAQQTVPAGAPVTLVVTSPPPGQNAPVLRGFYEDGTASQEAAGWLATLLRQKGWDARVTYYAGPDDLVDVSLRWHVQAFSHPAQVGGYDLPIGGRSVYVKKGQAASLVLIDRIDPRGTTHYQGYATAGSREVQTYSNGSSFLGQLGDALLGNVLSSGTPETAEAKAARNAFAKALGQMGELPSPHESSTTRQSQTGNFLPVIGPNGPMTTNPTPSASTSGRYPIRRSTANPDDIIVMSISGISTGQELTILQDGQYLAKLRVIQVLPGNQAKCRVIDANTYLLVAPGTYAVPR